jgi:hypothetical protein
MRFVQRIEHAQHHGSAPHRGHGFAGHPGCARHGVVRCAVRCQHNGSEKACGNAYHNVEGFSRMGMTGPIRESALRDASPAPIIIRMQWRSPLRLFMGSAWPAGPRTVQGLVLKVNGPPSSGRPWPGKSVASGTTTGGGLCHLRRQGFWSQRQAAQPGSPDWFQLTPAEGFSEHRCF